MVAFSTSICPPVLPWDSHGTGIYACFSGFHITEYFYSIHLAALVRINPVFSALEFRVAEFQVSAIPSRVFSRAIRADKTLYLSVNRLE